MVRAQDATGRDAGLAEGEGRTLRCLDRLIWSLIFVAALGVLLAAAAFSFGMAWRTFLAPVLATAVLAAAAAFYRHVRSDPSLSSALVGTAQLTAFTAFAAPLSYLAAAAALPLRDGLFDAADRALGLDWPALLHWMNAHPALHATFSLAYMSIQPQAALTVLALGLTARHVRLRVFLLAFVFAVCVTVTLSAVLPARGVWGFHALTAADYPAIQPATRDLHLPILEGLRDGSLRTLGAMGSEGIITFPSLHAALAAIFLVALWPVPGVRWVGVAVNVLMLGATPVDGGHYFVDVVAGVAIAVLCWRAAGVLARRFAEPVPRFDANVPAEAAPEVRGLEVRGLAAKLAGVLAIGR